MNYSNIIRIFNYFLKIKDFENSNKIAKEYNIIHLKPGTIEIIENEPVQYVYYNVLNNTIFLVDEYTAQNLELNFNETLILLGNL